jgi:PAS domain S-box-containing protein
MLQAIYLEAHDLIGYKMTPSSSMQWVSPRKRFGLSSRFWKRSIRSSLVLVALVLVYFAPASHAQVRKNVLMLSMTGPSHPAPTVVSNQIVSALHTDPRFQVEFYWENLNSVYHPEELQQRIDLLVSQYRHVKLDLIVLVGGATQFLAEPKAMFPNVPVVFCCAVLGTIEEVRVDYRSTGVWFQLEPAKTVEAARNLIPGTRHLFVVAGQSDYDKGIIAIVKTDLIAYEKKLDVTYLTDLPMSELLEKLRHLPDHSIVLYLSFFKDVQGREFLNAPEALPMITDVANAPVFGIADTYLGRGIVGGFVVSNEEEGKIMGRDALEIFQGKPPRDIPVVHGPNLYIFDWGVLKRWKLDESRLPAGSTVLFRQPTLWEQHRRTLLVGLLVLAGLGLLTIYLLFERKRLNAARKEQMRLTDMLVDAQEQERVRAASELHELQVVEEGLRESEKRMRLAVEVADFGISIRYLPRNEVWATNKWRAIFGFEPEERLDYDTVFQRIHPEDRDAVRSVLKQSIEGDGTYETTYRLLLPTGEVRWIASHGRTEFDGEGKPNLVRGLSLDITERKQAEDEKQLLQQEIAHAGRVSLMGQLASALAHEINQPLGAILRNAEAAELFLKNPSPDLEEIREILADIRKDDQRAGDVISRMRRLLKRNELAERSLDVRELVSNTMTLVQFEASARQIRLEVVMADDLPPIRGDAVHLQQVLLNLITNGMDALDETKHENPQIRVTASVDGQQTVEIAVSDTGDGIPNDRFAHIFDPFFTTKANGMGMGLSISSTIIEAHNGRLWAENNKDGGASFRFTLPIAHKNTSQLRGP